MSAIIRLNGEETSLDGAKLIDLLRDRDIDPGAPGLAIALNGTVVPRLAWPDTAVADGDQVEIVKLFAGG